MIQFNLPVTVVAEKILERNWNIVAVAARICVDTAAVQVMAGLINNAAVYQFQ